jgi:hypothetical protein
MAILINNFVSGQLVAPAADVDTVLGLGVAQGEAFPSPTGDDYSVIVVEDVAGVKEIMHMTSRSGDILTVTREEEGTSSPATFAIGSRVELRLTTGFLDNFIDGGTF